MSEMPPEPATDSHLIVVGASAGGIEALSRLVTSLPTDLAAPIIIAQHLDPARPSRLVEILSRYSLLPVRAITTLEPLLEGTVYVLPSDQQIEFVDHVVHLKPSDDRGPRPSVDHLFSRAATAHGEQLIAVVLSGTGSDGAAGARIVHENGGTVIIQNPETAAFPSMPRSLAPVTVDIVADVEDIGPLLGRLVTDSQMLETQSDQQAFQQILERVRDNRGIDFSGYRQPTIMRRLHRRMLATNNVSLSNYLGFVRENPTEEEELIRSFLIRVTDFFRDTNTFAYLRSKVLPDLITRAQDQSDGLRIWSAGCSTGEEAYSIAIMTLEMLREQQGQIPVRIFATDLESDAVNFARRGVYPSTALKNVPKELVTRYFREVDGEFEIIEDVRGMIVFGVHDLIQAPPFPRIDLLLCRNVLMYFTTELQSVALHAVAFALREGGYLVLGSADTPRPLPQCFDSENPSLKIFRRNNQPVSFRSSRAGSLGLRLPLRPIHERQSHASPIASHQRIDEEATLRPSNGDDSLFSLLPIGVVTIDDHYDIQYINLAARNMLGIHGVALNEDVLHLLTSLESANLRRAIDDAFEENRPTRIEEIAASEPQTGETRYLQVICTPRHIGMSEENAAQITILLADVTHLVRKRLALEQSLTAQQEEHQSAITQMQDQLQNIVEQMQEMSESNRRLLQANEALATTEERWRTLKDEYALANADAEAANEELETYAEELQASAEEMETLNEELKATVEELGVSNANLEARARELVEQRQLQDDFVERSSHELRTPLTAIAGYLQLLIRQLKTNAPDENLLRLTTAAIDQERRLETLINELMDVTRIQSNQLRLRIEPVDLVPMASRVGEVAEIMARGQSIVVSTEQDSLIVNGDESRLEGVLYNLLTNAIKYAPETERIEVHLRSDDGYAEITVRDYGPGIPADELPNIFSRFYQVEGIDHTRLLSGGLGLGLYIAKEVVTAHGGTIDVTSKANEGSTFTVRLPLRSQ